MIKNLNVLIFSIFFIMLTNCSETEFRTTPPESSGEPTPPPQSLKVNFERDINTTTNVDMIWVVDNSGSMTEEVAIIRKNLGDFLLSLEERAKLNFTLITSARHTNGMALSNWALSRGYKQISQFIDSRDSLIKLIELAPKLINPGIRANSKKIVVIVSDDNSDMSSNLFLTGLSKLFNLDQFKIFGFVGLSRSLSPCINNVGSQYIKLAELTDGKTFNICEADWTPYFENLVKDVADMTKTEFKLPSKPKGNIVVKVDGQVITKYSLSNNILTIHPDNFPTNKKYDIEVTYLP